MTFTIVPENVWGKVVLGPPQTILFEYSNKSYSRHHDLYLQSVKVSLTLLVGVCVCVCMFEKMQKCAKNICLKYKKNKNSIRNLAQDMSRT